MKNRGIKSSLDYGTLQMRKTRTIKEEMRNKSNYKTRNNFFLLPKNTRVNPSLIKMQHDTTPKPDSTQLVRSTKESFCSSDALMIMIILIILMNMSTTFGSYQLLCGMSSSFPTLFIIL